MMEILGIFDRVGGIWYYRCDMRVGKGTTPEMAYGDWLAGFEYRGEAIGEAIKKSDSPIKSANTDKEA